MTVDKNKKLKLAFIGGGNNSAVGYTHFSAARMDNKFEVVAGCFSRNHEVNISTAEEWGIRQERVYSDWYSLLEKEKKAVDAFVVLTPTPDHVEVLKELFRLRVPTICEKALVANLTEIRDLEPIFDKGRQFLAVTLNYSGYPMVRELKKLIENGELGVIQKIHMEMPQEAFKHLPPNSVHKIQQWRLEDGDIPTICLDLGVHLHHLSAYLTGKKAEFVSATKSNHSQFRNLVDDMFMLLKYEQGITGSMWISKTAVGEKNGLRVRLYGTKGSASWYQLDPDKLNVRDASGSYRVIERGTGCSVADAKRYNRMKPGHPTGFVEAFANIYTDISDALHRFLEGKDKPAYQIFDFEHSKEGLVLFDRAIRAAKENEWIKLF